MEIQQLRKDFFSLYGRDHVKEHIYFAPGRVCLIGEHIDYNGGLVMPAAISLGIYAVARYTDNNIICMKSSIDGNEYIIPIDETIQYNAMLGWANYPLGMIYYFISRGYNLSGCEILFHSTLPVGSGLSSSAAIQVLTGFLLSDINNITLSHSELALAAKESENNFIGVKCGIMDQFSVANGKKDNAMLLNCSTLDFELIPFKLTDYKLVIFNTNKKRELTGSAFNNRAEECNEAFRLLSEFNKTDCLANYSEEMVEEFIADETIKKRALHVVTENKRVELSAEYMKAGNTKKFGNLLFDSHESLKYNYEVSCSELDAFVDFAIQHPACVGAKMTGAGFGGCAVAIVSTDAVQYFMNQALTDYYQKTGINGAAYVAEISEGVMKLE